MSVQCEFCKPGPRALMIAESGDSQIFLFLDSDGYLQLFDDLYPGFTETRQVNFCPMCGRKLYEP